MRLNKEDRYMLKLVRLAKEVTKGEYAGDAQWNGITESASFRVWNRDAGNYVISIDVFSIQFSGCCRKLTAKHACWMAYINLSLWGIPAVVYHGDSIRMVMWSGWRTTTLVMEMTSEMEEERMRNSWSIIQSYMNSDRKVSESLNEPEPEPVKDPELEVSIPEGGLQLQLHIFGREGA